MRKPHAFGQWISLGLALVLVGSIGYQFNNSIAQRRSAIVTEREKRKKSACKSLTPHKQSPVLGKFPSPAPDFVAEDYQGGPVRLSAYRGKVVLLNFWAPWCAPCVEEAPSMERLARKFSAEPDVAIIGVTNEDKWEAIRAFFVGGTEMTLLRDPSGKKGDIGKQWGTSQIPDTYLIDRQGNIRYWYENQRNWATEAAELCLESLLEESPRESSKESK